MGGKMCKWSSGSDSDDYTDALADMDGAQKFAEDDEIDESLLMNSNLPEVFAAVDDDGTGQIEYPEFLAGFGLDNTPLCQKIFYLFDEDHSGALDYYEFLKAIDKYRKMTYDERLSWCFKVYDLDDSGYIDREEMTSIIMDINYQIRSYKSAKAMISRLNHKYEMEYGMRLEKVDLDQFKHLAASHGTLLIYPALGVMERVLGMAFQDPDNHLDAFDCIRPGQGGMILRNHMKALEQDEDISLG